MEKKDIIQFVNDGKWESAEKAVAEWLMHNPYDDEIAILDASIKEAKGMAGNEWMKCIEKGLQYNPANYELYVMLGHYYLHDNVNKAYLCYEQAELYCDIQEDMEYILQCQNELCSNAGCDVKPTSIVIVSYNCKDLMIECIESIRKNNLSKSYELIVADNNSTDGIREWLREQPDIRLIENPVNAGFAAAANQGVKVSGAVNNILFLNNDTIVTPNALFWLRMGLYEDESIGAAGSVSNNVGNEQKVEKEFNSVEEWLSFSLQNNTLAENAYKNKIWLSGFALLVKRNVLDNVGLFDERFGIGNYEDNDLGVRILMAGFRLVLCRNSFIFHYGSQSFRKDVEAFNRLIAENRKIFIQKWGFDINRYSIPRRELIEFITDNRSERIKVLEIGCGAGATLAEIQFLWPNAGVKGLETDAVLAGLAEKYLDVSCGDIENTVIPFPEKFDYIILTEKLECFYDPKRVLESLKLYLNENGKIIASISNIMHSSVLLPLLRGNFSYSNEGILDRKHIRFFTLKSIKELFDESGFEIERISYVSKDDAAIRKNDNCMEALKAAAGAEIEKYMDIYQYILCAGNTKTREAVL